MQTYDVCKWLSTLCADGCIHLFAHYTTSLTSSCRCIWKYWNSKMLVRYILLNVCLRLSPFYQLSFVQFMGLCVVSLPISVVMTVRISVLYLIIIIKSEVWPICHCLGLGHETMVGAVMYFYVLLYPVYVEEWCKKQTNDYASSQKISTWMVEIVTHELKNKVWIMTV